MDNALVGTYILQSVGILVHALLLATAGGDVFVKCISLREVQLLNELAAIFATL